MAGHRILVVDDDRNLVESMCEALREFGECAGATSVTAAVESIDKNDYDLVVIDLVLHDGNGLELLRRAKEKRPECEVIVVTGYPSVETAEQALSEGAYDYIDKPVNLGILRVKIRRALEKLNLSRELVELKTQVNKRFGYEGIIGNSEKMQKVFEIVRQVASADVTILILGESGTGKELIARTIHNNSNRRHRHFVPINCASIPESLIESELFGHIKGAYTGATFERKGRFEYANGGVLFLDEIGDMPIQLQPKILRAIENKEIYRIGSDAPIRVDVRILAATHRDLDALIKENKFREDLYYRLRVVTLEIPPLRERLEDIPLLVDSFIKEFAKTHGKSIAGISKDALAILYSYTWPGNVREIKNCIESMVVLSSKSTLDVDDIPMNIRDVPIESKPAGFSISSLNIEDAEHELIKKALELAGGNRDQAARILGIGERTLYRKLKKYGLQ